MNTLLFKATMRKILEADKQRILVISPALISDRVRKIIQRAEERGILLGQPIIPSASLPNLLAHIQCTAAYGPQQFRTRLSCWADGEVEMSIIEEDDPAASDFLWLRVLASGYLAERMNLHEYLHRKRGHDAN